MTVEDKRLRFCALPPNAGLGAWQPIESIPENVRVILTFDYISVYAGTKEGYIFIDGNYQVPDAIAWMPLPEAPNVELTGGASPERETEK